ncbi:MAG: arsenate reductase ArsC [Candidatus Limnocylindria bacterium]
MTAPDRVLFLCQHNSARSQMAEAMLRAWGEGRFEAHSAGMEATAVRPEAIAVMDELGIDIRDQTSKTVERYIGQSWEALIPVCEEACEACPWIPGANRVERWMFDDPSAATGGQAARMAEFRRVRDEIAVAVRDFIARG